MKDSQNHQFIVLGAGWYGLRAAKTLLDVEPEADVLIVDANASVGGTWSRDRLYPNLRVQSAFQHFEFSEIAMDKAKMADGVYIPGEVIYEYLDTFSQRFGLYDRMILNTRVTEITKKADGEGWILKTGSGSRNRDITCEKLIVATGLCPIPYIPSFPSTSFKAKIIHAEELGRNVGLLEKCRRVTIVGGGKSAFDAIYLALQNCRSQNMEIEWIITNDGSGPTALYPLKLLGIGFLDSIKLSATRFVTSLSPCATALEYEQGMTAWGRWLHSTRLGIMLVSAVYQVLTWICALQFSRDDKLSKLRPNIDSVFWCNAGLGLTCLPDFWERVARGPVRIHRTHIKCLGKDNKVCLEDGTTFETEILISCTGYIDHVPVFNGQDCPGLGLPTQNPSETDELRWHELERRADGEITKSFPILDDEHSPKPPSYAKVRTNSPYRLYRRMVPPEYAASNDRSIVFLGHIHTMNTPMIAEIGCLWAVAYLKGCLKVPTLPTMETEIARWNAWTRRRYLGQGEKTPYAMYDSIHYTDLLLHDLGLSPFRKRNWIAEIFAPYKPADLSGCTEDWIASKSRGKKIDWARTPSRKDPEGFKAI